MYTCEWSQWLLGGTRRREFSRQYNVEVCLVHDNLGHSFCYVRPLHNGTSVSFRSIPGASRQYFSTALTASPLTDASLLASGFESTNRFASLPLQRLPRSPTMKPVHVSGLFLPGPIESGLVSGPVGKKKKDKAKKRRTFSKLKSNKGFHAVQTIFTNMFSNNLSRSKRKGIEPMDGSDSDKIESASEEEPKIQWAQGKAGDDRVHIILSEENGWLFVGIYDGFSGNCNMMKGDAVACEPRNRAENVNKLPWRCEWEHNSRSNNKNHNNYMEMINHKDVLRALKQALKKTEEAFDLTVDENPELDREDVYVMSVGDSRAKRVHWSPENMEHSTDVEDVKHSNCSEVRRINKEHPDDPFAIKNDRVKGYLKVTRAFGAGFLKQ
ncbi:LOW QUALITY PROTEIN: hypothetical protein HID58_023250, partial [Brassica napus]